MEKRGGKSIRIYADAAASTPLHPRVKARLVRLLDLYANPGALHKEAVAANEELERARTEIAAAIGAHPDEIYFTGSGTEANNLAVMGTLKPFAPLTPTLSLEWERGQLQNPPSLPQTPANLRLLSHSRERMPDRAGEGGEKFFRPHALTLPIEHASVLEPLAHLQRSGLALSFVSVEPDGIVLPEKIASAIRPETVFISVQMVNSEIGTIQPIREIMKIVRRVRKERTALGNITPLHLHTDAAQAPLYLPLRVESLGVDLMTLDAQKILGPKGIGALYIRRSVKVEPILFGGSQERGLRPGTPNVPLAGAFAEALTLAQTDPEQRAKKVATLRDLLAKKILADIPDAQINGSMEAGKRIANNLNLSIPTLDGETAVIALDALGICISARSACSSNSTPTSHVLNALGLPRPRAQTSIRITILPSATRPQVLAIARALLHAKNLYGITNLQGFKQKA